MFDRLKNLFAGKPEPKQEEKPKVKAPKKVEKTEKELANERGEPYVNILRVEIDPENINAGAFELDWNDKFLLNLIKAGYKQRDDDTDQIIVDRWFQTVCRNVALEYYEQQQADPSNRMDDRLNIQSRNIGDGRREVR